jgi:PBP1b-binding outer membrane lipoprotein LpoB
LKKLASILALNFLLVGCVTVTPNKIQDDKSSYDATTPKQYDKDNGGLISFIGDDALITRQARERYNNLIKMYRIKFKKEKAIDLNEDSGVKSYKDNFGNELFLIDSEHLVYFGVLNSWIKEKVPSDNIIDKTIDKINN